MQNSHLRIPSSVIGVGWDDVQEIFGVLEANALGHGVLLEQHYEPFLFVESVLRTQAAGESGLILMGIWWRGWEPNWGTRDSG